jgi:hypothetical protein
MECREAQRILWADGPHPAIAEHVAGCPVCSREAVLSNQLSSALSGMRASLASPPPELGPILLSALRRTPLQRARGVVEHPRFWQGAAVAAAAAASVAGLLVAKRLQRPALSGPAVAESAA